MGRHPGNLIWRAQRWVNVAPALSVVVPVFNVERYIAECLVSLMAQSFTDFEVILVDDGATDSSIDIAREIIHADPRFRVLSQRNAGPGAARNAGVRAARGEYLAFLDTDDTLPPDAYAAMMATIERTGSDMVVGTLKRDNGGTRVAMRLMRENHRRTREAVNLSDFPLMLADVFAVNKIFRRSFWDRTGIEFPVDTHYEDQPALTRAFMAAKQFDVIRETVYLWRVRRDGSSITQRRHDLRDLCDRMATKRTSTAAVQYADPLVRDAWFRTVLPVDMWEYFRSVPGCSDEYWSHLRSAVAEFWSEDTVPFDRTRIPVDQRCMGWLVVQDRRRDLERLVELLGKYDGDLPLELRDDRVVALLPGAHDAASGLPETVFVLGGHELQWVTRIIEATWLGGQLRLRGFALIRNAATSGRSTDLTARLVAGDGHLGRSPEVEVLVEPEHQPRATGFVGRARQNYDDCGFACTIDGTGLAVHAQQATTWRLALERHVDRLSGSGGITSFDALRTDCAWRVLEVPATPGQAQGWVRVRMREHDEELVLDVEPVHANAELGMALMNGNR